ncbi:MAG: flagellar biosynthetic protein FliO [Chelatococcus sp.]|nr:flagellar biosynthetic protein FliO [Chelatococcus sp. HY11]MBX3546332.1 flagellar biosynthetic protein FliO [Chelatococcus sp.]CAH1667443.1 Flagellar biosynthesis protein FliO [Hyphomicrobiales bacterium]CAH1679739.1 Flagellar biosynthesis protein FliO [Hyphomicrobiales bacterium]
MQSFFGLEISAAVQYLIALIIIFALLVAFAVVLRRITAPRAGGANHASSRSRQPRLAVVDTFDLDQRRQLILLRRDNVEHLVMVGGPTDIVVESGILRGGQRALSPVGNLQQAIDEATQLPLDVALAAALPGAEAPAEVAVQQRRSEARLPPPPDPRQAGVADRRKPAQLAPMPPPRDPESRDPQSRDPLGMFRREAAPAAEKASGERPPQTDIGNLTARPVPPPRPVAATRPMDPATPPRPVTTPLAEKPLSPRPEAVKATPAKAEPATSDSEPISAMARELEQALQRPFSAARPATPAASTPQAPAPQASTPQAPTGPSAIPPVPPPPSRSGGMPSGTAAAGPGEPVSPSPLPPPAAPTRPRSTAPNAPWDQLSAMMKRPPAAEPGATTTSPEKPAAPQQPAPASPPFPVTPSPAREPAPTRSEPASVGSEAPAPASQKPAVDPFSVDDIEAEFARLLGRTPPNR